MSNEKTNQAQCQRFTGFADGFSSTLIVRIRKLHVCSWKLIFSSTGRDICGIPNSKLSNLGSTYVFPSIQLRMTRDLGLACAWQPTSLSCPHVSPFRKMSLPSPRTQSPANNKECPRADTWTLGARAHLTSGWHPLWCCLGLHAKQFRSTFRLKNGRSQNLLLLIVSKQLTSQLLVNTGHL